MTTIHSYEALYMVLEQSLMVFLVTTEKLQDPCFPLILAQGIVSL